MSAEVIALREPPANDPVPTRRRGALYWSVRREIWESRSIYLAPLAAAAVFLFGFLVTTVNLPATVRGLAALAPAKQRAMVAQPYDVAAVLLIMTSVIVGFFYCLDALHGERRDRSILFWKSLPVSDFTTVLAKAMIPLAVLPAIAIAGTIALQAIMLLASTLILWANGLSAAPVWTHVSILQHSGILIYGVLTLALWHAPVHAWLLLVSAWAQRAPFLWAVLPFVALGVLERLFGTSYVPALLQSRLMGVHQAAFEMKGQGGRAVAKAAIPVDPIPDPLKYLGSTGLWVGFAFAAALLALAIWLRRRREPI